MLFNHHNNSYDKISIFYDALSRGLGKSYKRSKLRFLRKIKEGDKVLYLGGGTGENLAQIMDRVGETGKVFYIEASSEMLKRAKKRISVNLRSRIVFLHQSQFSEIPLENFNIVLTQYFLDILPDRDIDELFQEIASRVECSTQWIFVDFFKTKEKRWLLPLMVVFFRVFTGNPRKNLPDYQKHFVDHGWHILQKEAFDSGFIQAWLLKRKNPKV